MCMWEECVGVCCVDVCVCACVWHVYTCLHVPTLSVGVSLGILCWTIFPDYAADGKLVDVESVCQSVRLAGRFNSDYTPYMLAVSSSWVEVWDPEAYGGLINSPLRDTHPTQQILQVTGVVLRMILQSVIHSSLNDTSHRYSGTLAQDAIQGGGRVPSSWLHMWCMTAHPAHAHTHKHATIIPIVTAGTLIAACSLHDDINHWRSSAILRRLQHAHRLKRGSMHTRSCTQPHTHIQTLSRKNTHRHMHPITGCHTHTRTHTHTHAHTHTHTWAHKQEQLDNPYLTSQQYAHRPTSTNQPLSTWFTWQLVRYRSRQFSSQHRTLFWDSSSISLLLNLEQSALSNSVIRTWPGTTLTRWESFLIVSSLFLVRLGMLNLAGNCRRN